MLEYYFSKYINPVYPVYYDANNFFIEVDCITMINGDTHGAQFTDTISVIISNDTPYSQFDKRIKDKCLLFVKENYPPIINI